MKTRSQQIADYAYRCVEEVKKEGKEVRGKYKSYVSRLPAMIAGNGLMMTVAFICGKVKTGKEGEKAESRAYEHLLRDVAGWFMSEENIKEIRKKNLKELKDSVVKKLSGCDVEEYRLYTARALEVAEWLKRMADALIEEEASNE